MINKRLQIKNWINNQMKIKKNKIKKYQMKLYIKNKIFQNILNKIKKRLKILEKKMSK